MSDTTTSEMIRLTETIVRLERELQKSQADAVELQRLRDDYAELVNRNAECAKQLEKFNGEDLRIQNEACELRAELKSAREEVERAKADRNKSGVEERKKYLPKIQELTDDLAKAKAQCAELRSDVASVAGGWIKEPTCEGVWRYRSNTFQDGTTAITYRCKVTGELLALIHGMDRPVKSLSGEWLALVPAEEVEKLRSEAEKAFQEAWQMAWDSPHGTLYDAWNNSRARKFATGELNK